MAKAVYPGSFDPVTLGHVDIIRRMSSVFDELTVLVAQSSEKNQMFTPDERKSFIRESVNDVKNLNVDVFSGLTVNYLQEKGVNVIIRGIRAISDFEYELVMANMNKKLVSDIETLIVFANPDFHYVSSRAIKEVAQLGGNVDEFVPACVAQALKEKYK